VFDSVKLVLVTTVFMIAAPRSAGQVRPKPLAAEKTDADRLAHLVAQLGGDEFAEREAAARALSEMGPLALEVLSRAVTTEDAEVRRRVQKLLRPLESRLTSERVLKPRRIRLAYQDVWVTDALTDLARKTGLALRITGDVKTLARRRMKLDTRDTTVWGALAQFCQAAGLTDVGLETTASDDDRQEYESGDHQIVVLDRTTWGSSPRAEGPLRLADGKWQPLPTCEAGAVRIRALPPGTTPANAKKSETKRLVLEMIPEPHLQWQAVLAVRVDRAIGEKGPVLEKRTVASGLGRAVGTEAEETLVLWDGMGELPANPFGDARQVPIRLRLMDGSVKNLKELSGMIAAQVRTPPEQLAAVDDIMKAAGQTLRAADGSSLQVIDVTHTDDGEYQVRVGLTMPPPELVSEGSPARLLISTRAWRGRGSAAVSRDYTAFSLVDAQGRALSLTGGEVQGTLDKGIRHDLNLVYQPLPNQGAPARLLYKGRRTVTVEIPFTLRDVPLP
jgi:hypothetical protein